MALAMLVVLAPFMVLIAIIVRLDSAGPALFRQERVGQNGLLFDILKFRTLTHGAPSHHHRRYIAAMVADCHAPSGPDGTKDQAEQIRPFQDPNVTRVGRWLRKTSLDELPQLVNVLRGEMSLVGPRPLPPYETAGLTAWARRRLTVPQGMTGLWQVSGRSTLPYIRMLELDIAYVDRWSLREDP
jgi:lipopolysaccharide/colanic/teichoic acid biosynthesis glycosyltransferase